VSRLCVALSLACLAVACSANDDGASSDGLAPFKPAAHRGFPQVPARGGVVLAHPRLVSVVASNDSLASDLFAYSDALTKSAWWKSVAHEYGISGFAGSEHVVATEPIAGEMTNAQVDAFVAAAIASDASLAPDGSTIYVLYFPPISSCSGGGSHHPFGKLGDAVARVQRCGSNPPTIASHEIIESATNPSGDGYELRAASPIWTGSVWSARDGEVGDLCESEPTIVEGAYHFDRAWSNAAAAHGKNPCVPADAGAFFDVSVARDWYAVAAGSSTTVKVEGWSSAKKGAWSLAAAIVARHGDGSGSGFSATLSKSTIANGGTVTLTVDAGDIAPGQWALVELRSSATNEDGVTPERHVWPVGFYVSPSAAH
jgi:hypothetical protein